ncbi:rod shape-determining protein MreC [Marinilactibacillus psychrotolerans]|uniref:Cell shape-determining protein MreC n=1 Tax=Marinilactibacillus psychrotolerans TaxID=191770 RepID=A0AAV3WPR9_9LACT|nr:rod shape-determining protein MreC [Marinilactibacillus psychrotolerans]GEL66111.1 cell shape-determining protein MreC [Marinilactibacillus psychrotolerans]GEQ34620.1 rod shape-determining protein MreC [Marinilactibacillus psychrotolerans]SDB97556.1 rod shape-determining protein MreC [Marinilactibacillus psychrotolerans]
MNQFFTNKKMIVLLVSVILFVSLLSLSLTQSGSVTFIQQFTNDITAVTGRVFSKPVNAVSDIFGSINKLQDTFEENQRLKKEIDSIYETQAEVAVLRDENERMQEELELKSSLKDFQTISGTVISRNPDSWVDQVIIDRGEQDGLEKGMSVMSSNGLIGRISETDPTSSKVVLLTNLEGSSNQVSAEILSKEVINGLITGYDTDTNRLIMTQITSTAEISEGEQVITSGLGGSIPRSLVIGTVDEVSMDDHGLAQQVYLKPATDFEHIRYVTVIDRSAESGEE